MLLLTDGLAKCKKNPTDMRFPCRPGAIKCLSDACLKAAIILGLSGSRPAHFNSSPSPVPQVANVNAKDSTCTLKDYLYKEVQKDWPGYSEGDQQLLKRTLYR